MEVLLHPEHSFITLGKHCAPSVHTCIPCLINPLTLSPQHSENSHSAQINRNTRRDESPSCRKRLELVCLKRSCSKSKCFSAEAVIMNFFLRAAQFPPHTDPDHFCKFYRNPPELRLTYTLIWLSYHQQTATNHTARPWSLMNLSLSHDVNENLQLGKFQIKLTMQLKFSSFGTKHHLWTNSSHF